MRAIRIDFSRRRDPLSLLGYGLFALVLIVVAFEGRTYIKAARELAKWQQLSSQVRQKELQLRRDGKGVITPAQRQAIEAQLKGAARVIAKVAQPWDDLFAQIEAASTADDVTLLGIEPDGESRDLRLTVESKSFEAMLTYVRSLSTLSMLANVYVVSHQVQSQDAQRPVRFVVAAKWAVSSGPAAGEAAGSKEGT